MIFYSNCFNLLYVVLITVLVLFEIVDSVCNCTDSHLCKPISKSYDQEVFIFSLQKENCLKYDWTKVTTIVEVGYHSPALVCHAHSHGARVVSIANFQPASNLSNKSERSKWINQTVQNVMDKHLDGVNVDFESPIYANQTDLRDGLTALMKELTSAIKAVSSHMQVTIDYAWSPHCIDGRCFDYRAIADIVDLAFVMAYDERSQIIYDCAAWANSPLNQTSMGVEEFIKLGIPAKKLVLGLPWYGYDYPCVSYNQTSTICHIKPVPFRGVPCSDAAGKQVSYSEIKEKLLPMSSTQLLWDDVAKSPYFTYQNSTTSQLHQVWFDNPVSLSIKYSYARTAGLRGVGMWEADDLDYSATPAGNKQWQEMWGALPRH